MIEENLKKITQINEELEQEEIALEQAVEKYSKALKLAAKTKAELEKIEQKILVLQKENEEIKESVLP